MLAATRILLGLWLMLTTAEWLVAASVFAPQGPLPWSELARGMPNTLGTRVHRRMTVRVHRICLVAQVVVIALFMLTPMPGVTIVCLGVLIASFVAQILLSGDYWTNGADKMGMIVMVGTLFITAGELAQSKELILSGLLVSGGQLTLSYVTAGVSKMFFPDWRTGKTLSCVMNSTTWGHPLAAKITAHRTLAFVLSWGVILLETLFPLALLAPPIVLWSALGAMLFFHAATAVFMRLNAFPWAFAAAYPAVVVLSATLRAALGWGL